MGLLARPALSCAATGTARCCRAVREHRRLCFAHAERGQATFVLSCACCARAATLVLSCACSGGGHFLTPLYPSPLSLPPFLPVLLPSLPAPPPPAQVSWAQDAFNMPVQGPIMPGLQKGATGRSPPPVSQSSSQLREPEQDSSPDDCGAA